MRLKPRMFANGPVRLAALAMLLVVMIPCFSLPSYAAGIPTWPTIRVALFLQQGSFNETTPTVTLSAPKGLLVGNRKADAITPWLGGSTTGIIRIGLDQYGIQVLDTPDYAVAFQLNSQLNGANYHAAILMRSRQGHAVFQVQAGPYPTREEAATALTGLSARPEWSAQAKAAILTGPLHLSAGTFANPSDAAARQATLSQAGIDAELVYLDDPASGKPAMAVLVGDAADPQQLASIQAKAQQQLPGLTLQSFDGTKPYAIKRDDATTGTAGTQLVTELQIANNGMKLAVQPVDPADKLTVAEKAGAAYPGLLEASGYNSELALVDELPFERYVGSVTASEMGTGWPLEALKAQAVAARTYALAAGNKYTIANISDSTVDQAFAGKEAPDTTQAAEATKGEVLVDTTGALISPVYSANAGGMTADPSEIWGGTASYLKPVVSPDDGIAKGKLPWLHIALPDGTFAFASSQYLRDTGSKNAAGLPIDEVTTDGLNIRSGPTTSATSLTKLNTGQKVVVLGSEPESTEFAWFRGPIDGTVLAQRLAGSARLTGPLTKLEVTRRGPSGRVTEMSANGQPVVVKYPYLYRSLLGDVLSTKFDIEETGRYTIQGAGGTVRTRPESSGTLYAVQGSSGAAAAVTGKQLAVLNGSGQVRIVTPDPAFIFRGNGYGHGLGLSQWGARGFAEQGYDYRKILTTYYTGVSIIHTS